MFYFVVSTNQESHLLKEVSSAQYRIVDYAAQQVSLTDLA